MISGDLPEKNKRRRVCRFYIGCNNIQSSPELSMRCYLEKRGIQVTHLQRRQGKQAYHFSSVELLCTMWGGNSWSGILARWNINGGPGTMVCVLIGEKRKLTIIIRISSCNCRSVMTATPYLLDLLKVYHVDLLCLSEHWFRNCQFRFLNNPYSDYFAVGKGIDELCPEKYTCSYRG